MYATRSYYENQTKQLVVFTKDMIVAVFLVIAFLIGTLFEIVPFSAFLNFGDGVKNSWEKEYGTAPYSHAELSSIDKFSQKLGYDTQKVKKVLESKNIKFRSSQSLLQISKDNNVSPQFIYNIV